MLSSLSVCKADAMDELASFVAKSKNAENFSDLCGAFNSTGETFSGVVLLQSMFENN